MCIKPHLVTASALGVAKNQATRMDESTQEDVRGKWMELLVVGGVLPRRKTSLVLPTARTTELGKPRGGVCQYRQKARWRELRLFGTTNSAAQRVPRGE